MHSTHLGSQVELIYDHDCPNIQAARDQILRAFKALNREPHWKEWVRQDSSVPPYVRQFGSPTVLVGGKDVSGESPSTSVDRCRVYVDAEGKMLRVPGMKSIVAALVKAGAKNKMTNSNGKRWQWKRMFSLLPVIGAALLPKLVCPACWPAYAGVLSSLGIGFVNYTPYLLPLMIVFVGASLFFLAFRATIRRGYLPFLIGLMGSGILLLGKFLWEAEWMLYLGLGILIGASVWNSWPKKTGKKAPALSCCSEEQNLAAQGVD